MAACGLSRPRVADTRMSSPGWRVGKLWKLDAAPCLRHVHPRRRPRRLATARVRALLRGTNGNGTHAPEPQYDMVALGNLCVDIIVPVIELPGPDPALRRSLLQQLSAHPPDRASWEVGGSCNTIIAAARLGMQVAAIGHIGNDAYGQFLIDILQAERVTGFRRLTALHNGKNSTLVCFVLVGPSNQHAFCSSYDFGPWPLLRLEGALPQPTLQMLQDTRSVFINGFIFDELPLHVVKSAMLAASAAGAAICFDPGPRSHSMKEGSRREALDTMLDLSHVVLLTEEEAFVVTELSDPESAARWVLGRAGAVTEWCVIKMGAQGALLCSRSNSGPVKTNAIKVDVSDTVGCGDSFAAAIMLGFVGKHEVTPTMMLANAVGAATAMGRGAGRNVAAAGTVMQLLYSEAARSSPQAQQPIRDAIDLLKTSLDMA